MYSQIAANSGDRWRSHCNLGPRLRFLVRLQHLDLLLSRGLRGGLVVTGASRSSLRTSLHAARPDKLIYCQSIQMDRATTRASQSERPQGPPEYPTSRLHKRAKIPKPAALRSHARCFRPGSTGPRSPASLNAPTKGWFVCGHVPVLHCIASQGLYDGRSKGSQHGLPLQGDGGSVPRIKVLLK